MAHLAMRAHLSVRIPDRRAAGAFPLLALGPLPQVEMGLKQQPQQLRASIRSSRSWWVSAAEAGSANSSVRRSKALAAAANGSMAGKAS
ncbi:hypothetical protein [Streptomyces sp. NPDC057694]|uniref:hypothetical protein n=1 Tax=Streptomyces sp. NPDC057694 TaxID=3346216 RepID=UPI00368AFA62